MIEINLLPEELKTKIKAKKELAVPAAALIPQKLLLLLIVVVALLVLANIAIFIWSGIKTSESKALEKEWLGLDAQRQSLIDLRQQSAHLSGDALRIQQMTNQRIDWAEKLNRLSLDLPSGIWFNELVVTEKDFTLKGSAVSIQKAEVGMLNKFLGNLKNDAAFFKDFSSLELGSVQVRVIAGQEVADFTINGSLKR